MDRDMRDWIRSLAVLHPRSADERAPATPLGDQGADYLAIARDGTLRDVLAEIAANEPDLAG